MNQIIKTGSPVHFSTFINFLLNFSFQSLITTCPNGGEDNSKVVGVDADLPIEEKGWLLWWRKRKAASSDMQSKLLYKEQTASGFSHLSWYTKVGGVKNCLLLEVTRDKLWITLSFLYPGFTEILDLDHEIKADSIIAITENTIAFKKSVLIKYSDSSGAAHTVEVLPKDPQNFRNALKKMMQPN